jgi:hypothetical protein
VQRQRQRQRPRLTALSDGEMGGKVAGSDVDNDELYQVERIVRMRMKNKKAQHLVKWKGWENEDNTWEPRENLEMTPAVRALMMACPLPTTRKRKRCPTEPPALQRQQPASTTRGSRQRKTPARFRAVN